MTKKTERLTDERLCEFLIMLYGTVRADELKAEIMDAVKQLQERRAEDCRPKTGSAEIKKTTFGELKPGERFRVTIELTKSGDEDFLDLAFGDGLVNEACVRPCDDRVFSIDNDVEVERL